MPKTRFDTTIHKTRALAADRREHDGDCIGEVFKGEESLGFVVLSEEMRVLDFFEQQIADELGHEITLTPDDAWFTDDGDDE